MPEPAPDVPPGWRSALLVAVPAAERAVAEHRARLDPSARDGVPAHLTVLYPFLPPARIDPTVLGVLAGLFAGVPAFDFTLEQVRWFGDEVVWLGPREPERFSALTGLAFAAFPSCPPYGGGYDEVIPHLTVGDGGGRTALRAAAAAVLPHLPIEATATEVTLMAGPPPGDPDSPPGQWRRLAAFPLG
jgi:2'-5' RNA ligase